MQSESPRNLVPCATIADLVSRAFPEAAAARAREVVAHGGTNPESTGDFSVADRVALYQDSAS